MWLFIKNLLKKNVAAACCDLAARRSQGSHHLLSIRLFMYFSAARASYDNVATRFEAYSGPPMFGSGHRQQMSQMSSQKIRKKNIGKSFKWEKGQFLKHLLEICLRFSIPKEKCLQCFFYHKNHLSFVEDLFFFLCTFTLIFLYFCEYFKSICFI